MATNDVLLKDVKPLLRGFDCQAIVLQRAEADPHFTRQGEAIYKYIVADKTGSMVLTIWGNRAECIKSGDILRITGAEARIRKGILELEALRASKVRRIGQDTMCFLEQPNYSELTPQQLSEHYHTAQPSGHHQQLPPHSGPRRQTSSPVPPRRGGFRGKTRRIR
ncbi:hypothetical protein K492DRAFT_237452 [Lichtheimia hyalospora FSU 10163]|nr:hypothetical protein K492DRAFT_237452 [Lichtheimia hyalospora FSU 10163]